jgi:hypothetical protein
VIDLNRLKGTRVFQGDTWQYFRPFEYEALPETHKEQILYLDKSSAKYVYKVAGDFDITCGDDSWGNQPFSGGCYREIAKLDNWKDLDQLKKWLYQRGVAFQSAALVLPVFSSEEETVLQITWKMLVKYAEIFFGFDNVIIMDPKMQWCLYYHHDDIIYFAEGRDFNR